MTALSGLLDPLPLEAVLGYLVAVFPLIATPGTSLALLIQQVADGGRRAGLPVVLGTVTGLYAHAALAGLGLSALVMRSSQAFTAVRLAGAVYLVGLGLWTWRTADATRRTDRGTRSRRRRPLPRTGHSAYRRALLGNVLNPKAAAIFLTLTPQFLTPHRPVLPQILLLATAQVLLVAAWLLVWTVLIGSAAATLTSATLRAPIRRLTGAVLVALGLRAAAA
ncbi:LysE family translocator [Kitasatospora sp. NPDC089797]|uniref:LysE family translocator n=1 Tax=Kitasatospora sp. NPDC089797 TaxID=3155298 RepID=UPI0034429380